MFPNLEYIKTLVNGLRHAAQTRFEKIEASLSSFVGEVKPKLSALWSNRPNWEQNDPNALDYVQGRTHYVDVTTEQKTITIEAVGPDGGSTTDIEFAKALYANPEAALYTVNGGKASIRSIGSTGSSYFKIKLDTWSQEVTIYLDSTTGEPTGHIHFGDPYGRGHLSVGTITMNIPTEIVHPIDQKFVPNADLNASEGETGYVKNRTHWEEIIASEVRSEYAFSTEFALTNGYYTISTAQGYMQSVGEGFFNGSKADKLLIMFDGVEYHCDRKGHFNEGECYYGQAYGNTALFDGIRLGDGFGQLSIEDTGEPFAVWLQGYYNPCGYIICKESGEHSIAAYEVVETVHPLDPKYLPDEVVTETELNAAAWVAINGNCTLPVSGNWSSVTYGDGKFVAVASNSTYAAYSTNGITWTEATLPVSGNWSSVTYGDGKFVAVASNSTYAAYSTDGITWTQVVMPVSAYWCSVAYGNGTFVAVGQTDTAVAYSTDGITWTQVVMPVSGNWRSVTYGDGKFVAVIYYSNDYAAAYSTDGINWTKTSMNRNRYVSVAYGNGMFVALAYQTNSFAYSTDGVSWTNSRIHSASTSMANPWRYVTFGGDIFIAIGSSNNKTLYAYYSTDGITWYSTALPTGYDTVCRYIAYGNDKFVAVGNGAEDVLYSYDGMDWTNESKLILQGDTDITEDVGLIIGVDKLQPLLIGTSGQVVGFDDAGNAAAQDSVQPDWNQNDETQPGYVKNRTHYAEYAFEPIVWDGNTEGLESVDFGALSGGESQVFYKISDTPITADAMGGSSILATASGESHRGRVVVSDIILPDVVYHASYGTMHESETGAPEDFCAGNFLVFETENDFSIPVGIYCHQKEATFAGAPHTIEITKETAVVPLDEKFIPDTIARVSDLPNTIIDVTALPETDIDEKALYRLVTGSLVFNQYVQTMYTIHCVEELPEIGEPATNLDQTEGNVYYSVADGEAYGYVDAMLSAGLGVPAGWYPVSTLVGAIGYAYAGVITDIMDDPSDSSFRLLLEYAIYSYKDDKWTSMKTIGWAGTGASAEVFNHPSNKATGVCSHAEGYASHAQGDDSHAEGYYSHAAGRSQHTQGEFNVVDPEYDVNDNNARGKYAHIVGNGTSHTARSNAHTLDWDGLGWFAGGLKVGGTGQDDETAKDVVAVAPVTAEVGQAIVVKAVDENGKPTAWETADMASDGGSAKWNLVNRVELTEEIRVVEFSDAEWQYEEFFVLLRSVPMANASEKGTVAFQAFIPIDKDKNSVTARVTQAVWTGTTVVNSDARIFKPFASDFLTVDAFRRGQMVTQENYGSSYNTVVPTDEYIKRILIYIANNNALKFGAGTIIEVWGR